MSTKSRNTLWELKPHTKIKHNILKKYLDAWIPILSKHKRINYIDGFAGPGEYSKGEKGSPIIAIKCLVEHKLIGSLKNTSFNFLFIERKKDRCENLKKEIKKLSNKNKLKCNIKVDCGEFKEKIKDLLDIIESKKQSLAPTFVFIDPFGFSGIPLELISRIMKNEKCEVFINFMYEDINRFFSLNINEPHLNSLFGTDKWKKILKDQELSSYDKVWKLHDLYKSQLKSVANIEFVQSFLMKNEFNKPDYFLFFGSNNSLGFEKMKEAMWKINPQGEFEFSDATYNPKQRLLFSPTPKYIILEKEILERFKNKRIPMIELERFVREETLFINKHIRKPILSKLENEGRIKIHCIDGKRKKGTFPSKKIEIEFI